MNAAQSSQFSALLETDAGFDPEVAEILEGYLTALEQGLSPGRDAFLGQHPRHAALLAQYLPWIELLYQAKPRDAESAANPPMPTRLGDFRVVREIGRGGMGVVYEAEQLTLARRVALKVLPFASMLDDRQLARFQNEALAAAQLHHPNIVPIFAVGCEQGLHFHVMQLIEGETLDQLIHDRRTPPADSSTAGSAVRRESANGDAGCQAPLARYRMFAEWIAQAADALDHAHNQGVVHRDIKPSNLMICREGNLWVTDFGLARTARDTAMTATGELLGTLRYMSPEQLRSKPGIVDHRTDIYSLGLTLYELVSQRPGFNGQSHQELIRQIEHDELPSLARRDRRVPRDLESIVAKATAKTPESRYASARDMADDLRAFVAGRPTVARPATLRDYCEKWIRRHAQLAAGVGFALALVVVCAVASAVLVWQAQSETQGALALASDNHRRAADNLQDARDAVNDVFTGVAAELAEIPGAENVRRQLLNRALTYYQKFIAQASTDKAVYAETAAAYYRCGQISEQVGDDDAARTAYLEAKKVWLALEQRDGDDQSQPLSLCENNLGLIHLRAGRNQLAESHLRESLRRERTLARQHPEDAKVQRGMALCYANLAMALGLGGQTDEARACLQQALDLQSSAGAASSPARGDLAATYNQLGYLCSLQSSAEAEAAYRHAAEEFQRLANDEPNVLRWQSEWATTLNNLAAVAAGAGRLDEAEAVYGQAIEIETRLVQRTPQVVAYARDLAVSQNNFGYLLSQRGRHEPAVEQLENARASLSRLAQAHDKSPEYASRLGAVCNNLGLACESRNSIDRAQQAYREAIDWQRKALTLSPDWHQAQTYLDAHTANLRRLQRGGERPGTGINPGDLQHQARAQHGNEHTPSVLGIMDIAKDAAAPMRPPALSAEASSAARPTSSD